MKFVINTKKRIKILKSQLWKIKRESQSSDEEWFSAFVKKFAFESGLYNTSVQNKWTNRETYFFKILDKQKYMLAKIKYGI